MNIERRERKEGGSVLSLEEDRRVKERKRKKSLYQKQEGKNSLSSFLPSFLPSFLSFFSTMPFHAKLPASPHAKN